LTARARIEETRDDLMLRCGECGERLVLLGRRGGWYEAPGPTFECGGCGNQLSLGSRIVPGARSEARSET
jgi:hypothetical protein